eukprot:NODE_1639_length_1269_cov_224.312609_g1624_i0.p1 GENE.NODE_1639_length_1269_cov_224.312609_g1624_i0~~NODE_1639_length_1269_cov_224.312609_g1624_i0.p1  ORF type:complete len:360 (-),score=80.43 NODE_1639_length_1269_cov_224.312609_g1624_i0:73-1152(-)
MRPASAPPRARGGRVGVLRGLKDQSADPLSQISTMPLEDIQNQILNLRKVGKRMSKQQRSELTKLKRETERRDQEDLANREAAAEEKQRVENAKRDTQERVWFTEQQARVDELNAMKQRDWKIKQLEQEVATLKRTHQAEIEAWEKLTAQLKEENTSLTSQLRSVEKSAERHYLDQVMQQDELQTVKTQVAKIQQEADSQNEHLAEVSSSLNQQLSYTQMENRVLRIERRTLEADMGAKLREIQLELVERINWLMQDHKDCPPRDCQLDDVQERGQVMGEFVEQFEQADKEYAALLQRGQEKVKNLHDFFYQLQPLHSNLPIKIRVQLQALSKNQLFLLLDVLACYEPVMRFLYGKFPP